MAKSNSRGGRNNNPSGRNQYSDWGVMEMARERPFTAAATAVGAAAAGLFLWSKRAQISEQMNSLSEQFGEWRDNMASSNGFDADDTGSTESAKTTSTNRQRGTRRSQAEISEEALTLKETGKATA